MSRAILQVEVTIPTQTRYLELIGSIGEHVAQGLDTYPGDREALAYHLNLVLTEATANAIKHGHSAGDKDQVKVCLYLEAAQLTIKIYDHGQGFDLQAIPTPDFDHPQDHGMGLFFIRTLMDAVHYTHHPDGNVLEIIKYL